MTPRIRLTPIPSVERADGLIVFRPQLCVLFVKHWAFAGMAWDHPAVAVSGSRVRIDRWLWAARFFKTRSLAADAIQAGHIQINDARAKAAKEVGPGDRVDVTVGDQRWTVMVRDVEERRGTATRAQELYEETSESQERRQRQRSERRLAPVPGGDLGARPTKRDRRRIDQARRGLEYPRDGL
jgi:ribosome-associated heat shock protein Hsp15